MKAVYKRDYEVEKLNILIALIPAIGWGIFPLIASKTGGNPSNQILGTGLGATLVGLLVFIFTKPAMDMQSFIIAFIAGALWTIGQLGQFVSMRPERMGVTTTMPISTGLQLVGNSIIGMLFLGDWKGVQAKTLGIIALAIVVLGVILTAKTDDRDGGTASVKDVLFLGVTTIGYWVYSSFPNLPQVKEVSPQSLFLPETLGILCGASLYVLFSKQSKEFSAKSTWLGMIPGAAWGIAAYAYIFSAQANGSTTAFIFTQLCVLISTIGGMVFLHEKKTATELKFTIAGLALIVIGSVMTGFI